MKRGRKLLLLALVVMAGASIAAIKMNPGESGEDSSEESTAIYTVDAESVTKLSWTYNGETVTLVDAVDGWMYEDDRNFPLDESCLDDMLSAISTVTASKVIEDVEDLAACSRPRVYKPPMARNERSEWSVAPEAVCSISA